jgi:hypothetical protein
MPAVKNYWIYMDKHTEKQIVTPAEDLLPAELHETIHGGSRPAHTGQLLTLPGRRPGGPIVQRRLQL